MGEEPKNKLTGDPLSFAELAQLRVEGTRVARASPALERALSPDPLHISQRTRRTAQRTVDAIQARRDAVQSLAFTPREFVLCGLPYKQPMKTVVAADGTSQKVVQTEYVRRNGQHVFKIVSDEENGLPYGQDRLLAIWLATAFKAAGQPDDNRIRFRAATDILRAFDHDEQSGFYFKHVRQGLARLHAATYFGYDISDPNNRLRRQGYRLMTSVDVWFSKGSHPNQNTLWQNVIELDPKFASDLRGQAVPIDFHSVRALKANPAALDLYIWQAYRSWSLYAAGNYGQVHLKTFGPGGLLEQLGSSVASVRKARQQIRRWQADVKRVWPECPNFLSEDGSQFILRAGKAVGEGKLALPGVSPNPPVPLRPRGQLRAPGNVSEELRLAPRRDVDDDE